MRHAFRSIKRTLEPWIMNTSIEFFSAIIIIIMLSTFWLVFALSAAAAARPSNISSVGELDGSEIGQNSPYILDDVLFVDGALDETKAVLDSNSSRRWPNGIVPYMIDGSFSTSERNLILEAMSHIMSKVTFCVIFLARTLQMNYIRITKGAGCGSYVGMIGGEQVLILGEGCVFKGTIIHELGHALGFHHEQSRFDRDDYLTVNFTNILEGLEPQFTKLRAGEGMTISSYDYDSIMQYGPFAFSKNGQPTMTPTDQNAVLKEPYQKFSLTERDIDMIKTFYCKF